MWDPVCHAFHDPPKCKDVTRVRKKYPRAFRLLKELIYDRDGRRCVVCDHAEAHETDAAGKRMPSLVVHHIDEDTTHNAAGNLITLCVDCHNTHHKGSYSPFRDLAEKAASATARMGRAWFAAYAEILIPTEKPIERSEGKES